MTRHSIRSRKENQILLQLSAGDRAALVEGADYVRLPVGQTFARVGEAISTVYFPDSGVLSVIGEMATGHHLAIAAVGAEGVIGLGALLGRRRYLRSMVVLVDSRGHRLPADRLHGAFQRSEKLRRVMLAHIGVRMSELMTAVACNRVHSHRQRLARWLLTATDKARQPSLPVTHDALAQMVGGPRHAVTVALNELRAKGAIAHLRGRIDVTNRTILIAQACECYAASQSGTP